MNEPMRWKRWIGYYAVFMGCGVLYYLIEGLVWAARNCRSRELSACLGAVTFVSGIRLFWAGLFLAWGIAWIRRNPRRPVLQTTARVGVFGLSFRATVLLALVLLATLLMIYQSLLPPPG